MTDLISREAVCKIVADRVTDKFEKKAACHGIRALPAALVSGERVHHVKRGSTYRVIGRGAIQTDTPLKDYAEVVVYQGDADGKLWVRPVGEFDDGRFAAIAVDASQTPDPVLSDPRVKALVEALRRIREAWPTVRDAEGSGGTISAAIDEIDAALAEIDGEK